MCRRSVAAVVEAVACNRLARVGGFASVSHRPASSPGAASAKYHEKDGVEILRDDDVAEWKSDRWSVVISPERNSVALDVLASHVLGDLEERYGALRGGAWIHREKGGKDHLHIAVDGRAQSGRAVHIPVAVVEKAVQRGMKVMERERTKGIER